MRRAARLLLAVVLSVSVTGCASAMIVTEQGLTAGAEVWHDAYMQAADDCAAEHAPRTPGMEACFGGWYDADAKVGVVLKSAVGALRAYWVARAAGARPDIRETLRSVHAILRDLPPEARSYFRRVTGVR